MKVTHIVPCISKKMVPLYKMLEMDDNNHNYITCIPYETVVRIDPEMLVIRKMVCMPIFHRLRKLNRLIFIYRKIKDSDLVVWHSLSTNGGLNVCLLLLKKIRSKSLWLISSDEIKNKPSFSGKFMSKICPSIYKYVKSRIAYYGKSYAIDDSEQYDVNPFFTGLFLPYPYYYDVLQDMKNERNNLLETEDYIPSAMIGFNSKKYNNHEILNEFADSNNVYSRIIFPLAYSCKQLGINNISSDYSLRIIKKIKKKQMIVDNGYIRFEDNKSYLINSEISYENLIKLLCQVEELIISDSYTINDFDMLIILMCFGVNLRIINSDGIELRDEKLFEYSKYIDKEYIQKCWSDFLEYVRNNQHG